ncbi:Hypp4283 [Branchiostoma lanceolatum]|uniref:Hypp4283 protein n=1 Tax=Branchiostoma lanceolatum TaxID=7740 RepID=A0A8K0F0F8_BRALA|nr:Hypp4283 [Branchiostoma lanceolatum]
MQAGSGHRRAASAGSEVRLLRETASQLRRELVESRAETQKATDRLHTLIGLVKRAWSGDETAAVHVANIVGVAPPTFHPDRAAEYKGKIGTKMSGDQEERNARLTALPKSRAVNNWALLTIRVLNREYCMLEEELRQQQHQYLHRREMFMNEQLEDKPGRVRTLSAKKRSTLGDVGSLGTPSDKLNTAPPPSPESTKPPLPHGRSPSHGHLYRPASGKRPTLQDDSIHSLVDLFIEPTYSAKKNKEVNRLRERAGSVGEDSEKYYQSFSERYPKQPDLYSANEILEQRKRPVSAKELKEKDAMRARPKSGVKQQDKNKSEMPDKARPSSAQVFLTQKRESNPVLTKNELKENKKSNTAKRPVVKKSEQAEAFAKELQRMEQMEREFKKTTKMLQQRLGISGEGEV